jgi:integrase
MSVRRRTWTTKKGERREAWVISYSDTGGTRRLATFDRKRDADAYEAEVKTAVRAGSHVAPSASPTVAEAAEDWLQFIELEGRERTTLRQYRQHARLHIIPRIGGERLSSLTTPQVHAFRDDLLRSMSRPMAKKVLVSLKAIFKDAQRRGSIAHNPAQPVSVAIASRDRRRIEVGVDVPFSKEVVAILDKAGKLRTLVLVTAFVGLRASELLGLRWSDVDLRKGSIRVAQRADRYKAIGEPKSAAGSRSIPIGPHVRNALRAWKLAGPKGALGLVFPNASGEVQSYDEIHRQFGVAQIRAGVVTPTGAPKYGLHALRHFYASWCINPKGAGGLGLPIKTVQARLGHSGIQMTADTYGHLFPASDEGAELAAAEIALLGQTLGGAT